MDLMKRMWKKQQTTEVFEKALKLATGDDSISCPPMVFIGLDPVKYTPKKLQDDIMKAPVVNNNVLSLHFSENVCGRCAIKFLYGGEKEGEKTGCVIKPDGSIVPHTETKCHPRFIPLYTTGERVGGFLAAIFSFGIALVSYKVLEACRGSAEICVHCKSGPGAEGCKMVGEKVTFEIDKKKETVEVDHINKL